SLNVTVTDWRPSAGIGVACHIGAHGELEPTRVSSHALTCGGSNVTLPPTGPRYRNHDVCRPMFLPTVIRVGGRMAAFASALFAAVCASSVPAAPRARTAAPAPSPRRLGIPSSLTSDTNVIVCPAFR